MKSSLKTHLGFRNLIKNIFDIDKETSLDQEWNSFEELLVKKEFKALTKNFNGFLAIFNYRTGLYEYMSEGIVSNLGFEVYEFIGQEGSHKIYSLIREDHAEWFLKTILKDVLTYLSDHVTSNDGLDYRFSCCMKLTNIYNIYEWYILDTMVIQTEANGLPRRTLITFTNIESFKKDNYVFYNVLKKDASGIYRPVFEGCANPKQEHEKLTPRELEILSFVAQGLTSKKIAEKLNLSIATVLTHRRNIIAKTKCKGPVELVNFAFSRAL